MPLRPGETAMQYARRDYCDERCRVAAERARAAERKTAKAKAAAVRRGDEAAAIARFIAERGVTIVAGPEQVAEYLRRAGHTVLIQEAESVSSGQPVRWKRQAWLDGRKVPLPKLYQAANAERVAAGLKPVAVPAA